MEVSVRELKDGLSEYLRRVARGEEVIVTSRGRPVARLGPLPATSAEQRLASREQMAAVPGLRVGRGGRPRGSADPIRVGRGERQLSELVLEDRR